MRKRLLMGSQIGEAVLGTILTALPAESRVPWVIEFLGSSLYRAAIASLRFWHWPLIRFAAVIGPARRLGEFD